MSESQIGVSGMPSTPNDPVHLIASQRAQSGLLVFTPLMELVHINEEAMLLATQLTKTRTGHAASGILPHEIVKFCEEIVARLVKRVDAKEWEHFELRHMIGLPTYPLLLRGFGLPDNSPAQARIMILMERISLRGNFRIEPTVSRYNLTKREEQVLHQLAKGLTNKEIANDLEITENTVKEHIKRLMHKMQVTTRTGLLSRILQAASNHQDDEIETHSAA
jgi:DNA-binding CsgD family transcriptional regulator